jgi:cobalt-zinc-cadmium efflux system membrane fusion protein
VKRIRKLFTTLICAALSCGVSGCSREPVTSASGAGTERTTTLAASSSDSSGLTLPAIVLQGRGIGTEVVSPVPISGDVKATGQIVPNDDRTYKVGAHVSGRIGSISVNLGDHVSKGQIVLRVHSHEIHDTRAAYLVARESVRQMQDRSAFAQRVRDRARRLLALEAISREQADQAETEWNASLAAVDSAKAQLDSERTHLVEVLEVGIDSSGVPEDVETVPVRAPASGMVIERRATVGSVASAGDVLLSITDPASLWVIANVNEAELSSLHPGLPVDVQVRAYPDRTFRGRIEKLGESLDPGTRTLQVRVSLPNREGLLKPEMFANVAILRKTAAGALTVPHEAVQDLNGHPSVFIETSRLHYRPQTVVIGQSVGDRVQVVSGLSAGDRVVVQGGSGLKSKFLKTSKGGE